MLVYERVNPKNRPCLCELEGKPVIVGGCKLQGRSILLVDACSLLHGMLFLGIYELRLTHVYSAHHFI